MSKAPRAYRLDHPDVVTLPPGVTEPFATSLTAPVVVAAEADEIAEPGPESAPPVRRGSFWPGVLLSALGGLALFGIGLWIEDLVARLFTLAPALGYAAAALAATALLAFLVLLVREALGVLRERRIERLRQAAADAHATRSDKGARAVVGELLSLYAARPETARARGAVAALDGEIVDADDRLAIAEQELMAPLDAQASRAIAQAAKQVSLVTTISPRAIVDVGFVLYASFRLVRRLAAIYGGRPGFFGFLRLARNVTAHLAVTGGVAAGDSLIQQVMGLGLAARVSAKLGEGLLNGLLTARVGLAAMDVCRPLPFLSLKPPTLTDVAGNLMEGAGKEE